MISILKDSIKKAVLAKLREFNPYHDRAGRFATAHGNGIIIPANGVRYKTADKKQYTLSEKRSMAGKAAQKHPISKAKRAAADAWQAEVAHALGGESTKNSHPVDIITKRSVLEVKTLLTAKNDKVTSHKKANKHNVNQVSKKTKFAKSSKKKLGLIAVDARKKDPVYYFRPEVGSFRLKNMMKFNTKTALVSYLKKEGFV